MKTRDKKESNTLTLLDAIETLSSIADLEFDHETGIAQEHDLFVQHKPLIYHTVHWLHHKDAELTIDVVKQIFRVVLNYLRQFYDKEYATIKNEKAIEGIKTIMVLVGEAAKKLDKYTKAFSRAQSESITELKEYKKLQEFYLSRIDQKIDEGMLGKWILALSNKWRPEKDVVLAAEKAGSHTKHIFVDLESVKKDSEYELFFLRKEDGSRFFSPRLVRNVKLVSDFGGYFGETKGYEPLSDMVVWKNHFAHKCALQIMYAVRLHIDKFYRESIQSKDNELVESLNKAFMALMLCCNPHNLVRHAQSKTCSDYFYDFRYFLRVSLSLINYHKMITYPPKKSSKLEQCLLNTLHYVCLALYTQIGGLQNLTEMVHAIIQRAQHEKLKKQPQAAEKPRELWRGLADDYTALSALIKRHPNGPINKILEALEEGRVKEFDPLMQGNIPSQLFTLYTYHNKILFTRWPSPTRQEFIHKASVIDEFKGFLRACAHENGFSKCLIFNFQDRTLWKERCRCLVIEDLPNHESFTRHVDVVSLAKDTEFYHQLAPYSDDNHAEVFKQHFKEHLIDENCGYIFPDAMHKELFGGFIDRIIDGVHWVFFSNKNILLREHRLDFIEIVYLFLQLKIVELSKADVVGYTCKDSVDIAQSAGAELFVFLKLLHQERLSENDREQLETMLYGPCLLERERLMLPERFNRLISAIKALEVVKSQIGNKDFSRIIQETFGNFYQLPILQSKVIVQRSKDLL